MFTRIIHVKVHKQRYNSEQNELNAWHSSG